MYYDQHGNDVSQATFYALKGSALYRTIGRWAAQRYVLNNGSTLHLLTMARQLNAAA